jgi:hypothetical protein
MFFRGYLIKPVENIAFIAVEWHVRPVQKGQNYAKSKRKMKTLQCMISAWFSKVKRKSDKDMLEDCLEQFKTKTHPF